MNSNPLVFGLITRQKFDDAERLLKLIASIAAVIALFFAAQQVRLSTENARRQTTLDILKPTHEEGFLLAFQRLLIAQETRAPLEKVYTERLATDRNMLLTVYDSIAIHYQYGTIDKCIVKTHIYDALEAFKAIQEYLETPPGNYQRVSKMRASLENISCPTS